MRFSSPECSTTDGCTWSFASQASACLRCSSDSLEGKAPKKKHVPNSKTKKNVEKPKLVWAVLRKKTVSMTVERPRVTQKDQSTPCFFTERGRGCSWSLAFTIFDIFIRDQSMKLSEIVPNFGPFCPPKYQGCGPQKLYPKCHDASRTSRGTVSWGYSA